MLIIAPWLKIARFGNVTVFRVIMENVKEKNPKNAGGWTPLHDAACKGYFDVCQLIVERVDDKNPATDTGYRPLHYAAENGHVKICQLIMEHLEDIDPDRDFGWTQSRMHTIELAKKSSA